jgi:hypothetical protein
MVDMDEKDDDFQDILVCICSRSISMDRTNASQSANSKDRKMRSVFEIGVEFNIEICECRLRYGCQPFFRALRVSNEKGEKKKKVGLLSRSLQSYLISIC